MNFCCVPDACSALESPIDDIRIWREKCDTDFLSMVANTYHIKNKLAKKPDIE